MSGWQSNIWILCIMVLKPETGHKFQSKLPVSHELGEFLLWTALLGLLLTPQQHDPHRELCDPSHWTLSSSTKLPQQTWIKYHQWTVRELNQEIKLLSDITPNAFHPVYMFLYDVVRWPADPTLWGRTPDEQAWAAEYDGTVQEQGVLSILTQQHHELQATA